MGRQIDISYRDGEVSTPIELRAPYFLFGTQQTSKDFWSNQKVKEIGLVRLPELGSTDPIYFIGWVDLDQLLKEIQLIQKNLHLFKANAEVISSWLSHIVYAHSLLITSAPAGTTPELTIG